MLSDPASSSTRFLTEAVGNREQERPIRRRPVDEALGLGRQSRTNGLATVLRPASELATHPLEPGVIEVPEVVDLLALEAPLHLDEDRTA